jgi:hypothetical protein
MFHEWIVVAIFVYALMYEHANKNFLHITWVDKIFAVYFVCALVTPTLVNLSSLDGLPFSEIKGLFIPIKWWIVYRIMLCIWKLQLKASKNISMREIFQSYFNIILILSFFAAFIGYLRFLPLGSVSNYVNQIWPLRKSLLEPELYTRLISTMSGANGSGIFFAIVMLISFYLYTLKKGRYLYLFSFFGVTMMLTGSFTAILSFLGVFAIRYREYLKPKYVMRFGLITVSLVTLILMNDAIYNFTEKLVDSRRFIQFEKREGWLPGNLQSRISRWPNQLMPFYDKPVFGSGPEIEEHIIYKILAVEQTTYEHNYYVYLLNHSGIVGLCGFLYFMLSLLRRNFASRDYPPEANLLISILIFVIVTQIAQLPLQYGGISELFGVVMALSFIINTEGAKRREFSRIRGASI